jgi:hypothetical protein
MEETERCGVANGMNKIQQSCDIGGGKTSCASVALKTSCASVALKTSCASVALKTSCASVAFCYWKQRLTVSHQS